MEIGNKLEVIYKGDIKAGELWIDNEGYHFSYDDDYIEDDNTRPISVRRKSALSSRNCKRYSAREVNIR